MTVSIAKQGRVAVVAVDNPPVNASSQAVRAGLLEAVAATEDDPDVDAVVLACAGRTFVAGADVREFDLPPVEPHLPDVISAIEAASKPWVAAIHGTALGGGLAAIFVGDLFVQYPKLEVRFWYVAILLVLLRWRQLDYLGQSDSIGADPQVKPGGAGPGNGAADGRPLSPPARI